MKCSKRGQVLIFVTLVILMAILYDWVFKDVRAHPPMSEAELLAGGYHEGIDGVKHKHHLMVICSTDPDYVNVITSSEGDSMVFCLAKYENVGFSIREVPEGEAEDLSPESETFNDLIKDLTKQMEQGS